MVKKGIFFSSLTPAPFIAAVDRAKGLLSKEEANLWNARVTRERLEPLYVQHAASRRDLDNAVAAQLVAEASVLSAKANLVEAELNLSYTTILSPITGLSGRAKYREGTLITPGENADLTTISVLDPIWVDFNVPSNETLKNRDELRKGYLLYPKDLNFTMQIVLSDGSIFPYPGKANFASPTLDERTGTMLVRATFSNPYQTLKPGEFAKVRALGAVRPNSLFVPQTAVLESKSGTIVYVVNENNQAEMKPVVAGDWYEKSWVMLSGLKAGDRVIVDGVNKVQPGTSVIVTKEVPSTDPTLVSTGSINPSDTAKANQAAAPKQDHATAKKPSVETTPSKPDQPPHEKTKSDTATNQQTDSLTQKMNTP